MPIGKTRRIFIRKPRRRISGRTLRVAAALVLLSAGATGGAKLSSTIASIAPPARAAVQARRPAALASQDVAVIDGETLRLQGQVVHLDGVAAPQRGQACRLATDCAAAAALHLAALVRDQHVACTLDGADPAGRPAATCRAGGTSINQAVVEAGWAVADADQPGLRQAEADARQAHRGLWSHD